MLDGCPEGHGRQGQSEATQHFLWHALTRGDTSLLMTHFDTCNFRWQQMMRRMAINDSCSLNSFYSFALKKTRASGQNISKFPTLLWSMLVLENHPFWCYSRWCFLYYPQIGKTWLTFKIITLYGSFKNGNHLNVFQWCSRKHASWMVRSLNSLPPQERSNIWDSQTTD